MLEWKWQQSTPGMGSRCPPVTWRGGGREEVGYFQISWFKSKAKVLWEFSMGEGGGLLLWLKSKVWERSKLIPPLASVNLNSRSLSHDRICQPKYICSSTICPPSSETILQGHFLSHVLDLKTAVQQCMMYLQSCETVSVPVAK